MLDKCMELKGHCRNLGSQLSKFHCELVVCQTDVEELSSCLDGLLHEDQIVCEQKDR